MADVVPAPDPRMLWEAAAEGFALRPIHTRMLEEAGHGWSLQGDRHLLGRLAAEHNSH